MPTPGRIKVGGLSSPRDRSRPSGRVARRSCSCTAIPVRSSDWTALVDAAGELGRAVAFDMPGFGKADKPRDFDYQVSCLRGVPAGRARRAGDRARAPRAARLRRPVRPVLGPAASGGVGERRPDQHRHHARLRMAQDGQTLAHAGARRADAGLDPARRLAAGDAERPTRRAAAGVRGQDVRRLRPRHAPHRAQALPRDARPGSTAASSVRRWPSCTSPRWWCGGPRTRLSASSSPSASASSSTCDDVVDPARQRPLALPGRSPRRSSGRSAVPGRAAELATA